MLKNLHSLTINTLSIDIKKEKTIKILKNNIPLLRDLVMKLRDITYYQETIFLEEIGLLKKAKIRIFGKKELRNLQIQEFYFNKKELTKLEQTVYNLIDRIIFLDKKLLKDYKKQELRATEEKKLDIKHLQPVLTKQSEMLCHLESKLPPANKIKAELLKSQNFTHWVARVLALMAALESEHQKEIRIFKKLNQKGDLRKKLSVKINHLLKEKEKLLKLKDERIQSTKIISKLGDDWVKATHNYTSALR